MSEAKRLLAEAGYPGGKGLPSFSLQVLNDTRQPKLAEAVQAMWARDLGVHVTIETNEQKIWFQTQQSMQHQIGFMGWTADFPDPVTFLSICQTGNGNNWSGWSNPAFDRLMEQAANTANPQARYELMQQAEAILLAEMPTPPLIFRSRIYLMNPAVKNWDPAIVGIHLFKKVIWLPSPFLRATLTKEESPRVSLRALISFCALGLIAALPAVVSAQTATAKAGEVTIVRVQHEWRDAASFKRIAEYFDGQEHNGGEALRRSHPESRAGYYFFVRVKNPGALRPGQGRAPGHHLDQRPAGEL
ncbi:MAG: ABC transporter substrate-binding protein [Lacunisphaera sp.]